MKDRDRLLKLCVYGLQVRGLAQDQRYKDRLKKDLKEIDAQGEYEYFLNLHDKFKKENLIFKENQHNNSVDYLLFLTDEFDIEKPAEYIQGEFPDIDIDYIREVRDDLKRNWAVEQFGQEFICEIGTYGTSGIKGAILDMARVHSLPKGEIQPITVKMEDKDDEGHELEWDKALEMYPEFRDYCERNQEVAECAHILLDRIRTSGVHAGGLIVSDRRIDGFVPLEVRMVNKENPDGVICSAWTEGLNRQDLQPVGLIKFDLLVVNNLKQIAVACNLVKERHGIDKICALPGQWDFSDISYLNDPKCIEMANKADLKCIFQFDSEGIRKLVKRGGVSSFDDIAAYSALYRPGCLMMGMDVTYCRRKKGEEPYSIHPLMQKTLGATYGVLVYQEQIMEILRVVGEIPEMHTEKVRKAISKKNIKGFIKYKELFLENGQKNLNANKDYVENLWSTIESFAEYGFNKSVPNTTLVPTRTYDKIDLKQIKDFVPGDIVFCVNEQGETVETEVVALHDHGYLQGFEVTFDDGYKTTCSANHKFLTEKGQVSLKEICRTRSYIFCDQNIRSMYAEKEREWLECNLWGNIKEQGGVARTSEYMSNLQESQRAEQIGEIESDSSMWSEVFNERSTVRPSERMQDMQEHGLEERSRKPCGSMWDGVSNLEREGGSYERVSSVRRSEETKHQGKDGFVECRKHVSREEENIFRHGQENFGTSRDKSCQSRESKKMERRESREVCEMHRSSMEVSKTIKDGELGPNSIGLAYGEDSLWQGSKASRSSEREYLDRSGRVLSFLRTQEQFGESVSTADSSGQRPDVKRGMFEEGQYNASAIEHGMFCEFDGSDEDRDLGLGAGHAEITDTRNLVHRKIVRVVPVGECHMFDLEVANPTHNFLLPNGIVTSNSHSYAYAYISARLLWLKAHYPIEFYTATLMCAKDTKKFKDYKLDAEKHGIEICPVHINKSKKNFSINGDKIYFGFSNIKNIGATADRIVENQPYADYPDFLDKYGTDATTLKALTSLGVFEEKYDRVTLRKFSEWYKTKVGARKDRKKRFEQTLLKKLEELKKMLLTEVSEDDPDFEKMCAFTPEAESLWKSRFSETKQQVAFKYRGENRTKDVPFIGLLEAIVKRREKSISGENDKKEMDSDPVTMDKFDPASVTLEDAEMKILTDELVLDGHTSYPIAESMYYGFQWTHLLETIPDYTGATIDKFLEEAEKGLIVGNIEIQVASVKKRVSKSNVTFYSVEVEDANGKRMTVNVWQDDYNRFEEELKEGNLLSMQVNPPGGGFNTLTFKSVPRHERKKLPPKEDDSRLIVMKVPERQVKKEDVLDDLKLDEEIKFDSSAIQILSQTNSTKTLLEEPFFGD
jgi:DNA polymerase III alpha subunit